MFVKEGLSNVSALLVDEETDRLFVGGRDVISALDLNNISRETARVSEGPAFIFNLFSNQSKTLAVDLFIWM